MEKNKLSLLEYIIAAIFGITIIIVTCQIVWRYVFNNSLPWSEELSRYLFVWIMFLGAAIAVKEGTHIRIDLFLQRLGVKKRRIADIWLLALMFLTFCYFLYYGVLFVIGTKNTFSTALGLPINLFVYSALPISCLIGMYYCVQQVVTVIRAKKAR